MAFLKRLTELVLAALLVCICALTIGACLLILGHFPKDDVPFSMRLQLALLLGFGSSAGLLFAARLAFPRLRVEGGRIIGVQGVWRFMLLWTVALALGLWSGDPQAKATAVGIILVILLRLAWRSTFGSKSE